jgi:haloacetate dehalogenase
VADWFGGFESHDLAVGDISLRVRTGGDSDRPPVILLHGFPQTHVMWRRVADRLRDRFFLVLPDLRGYGDSSKPAGSADHATYSKRTMAGDIVAVADHLQLETFALVGHDRGARVAARLALDFAQRVSRLCLLDVAPTLDMCDGTTKEFATAYHHWFHLIQPSPLPEAMIEGARLTYLHSQLGAFGGSVDRMEPMAVSEYERCFTTDAIHAICEDYRASASIDLDHDRESRALGRRVTCETLVLCATKGIVASLFAARDLWQAQCAQPVIGGSINAGHFLAEEAPDEVAEWLSNFLGPSPKEILGP